MKKKIFRCEETGQIRYSEKEARDRARDASERAGLDEPLVALKCNYCKGWHIRSRV